MGNASVGKSSILVQLTDKRFLGASSEPTVGDGIRTPRQQAIWLNFRYRLNIDWR